MVDRRGNQEGPTRLSCHTDSAYSGRGGRTHEGTAGLPDHIELDADESDALLKCLMRAAEVDEDTGNLDLVAMAEHLGDLIIDKWFDLGET